MWAQEFERDVTSAPFAAREDPAPSRDMIPEFRRSIKFVPGPVRRQILRRVVRRHASGACCSGGWEQSDQSLGLRDNSVQMG